MRLYVIIFCLLLLCSCGSSQKTVTVLPVSPKVIPQSGGVTNTQTAAVVAENTIIIENDSVTEKINTIINTALSYNGTRYKYGGTTRNGMDCSGLVYTSFKENDIELERSSYLMAKRGYKVALSDVHIGDLVFFITRQRSKQINHVGLVIEIKNDDVKFIHATTSRGVLISSIKEEYWNAAFVEARRVL